MNPKLSAGNSGTFAFLAGIFGGSTRRAIFVTAIPPGTAATTITLNPLSATAVAQQSVGLSAAVVSPVPGSPSGIVTFFANGISLGTGTLNSSGQASISTSTLAAGQHSIVAQYSGDTNFAAGNSSPLTIVVAGFAPLPSALAVTRGQSLVIPLTLYGPATPAMSFTLSCSGLPANASCLFDNNPVTPGPAGTTVHLTFSTTMASAKLPLGLPHNRFPRFRASTGDTPCRAFSGGNIILAPSASMAVGGLRIASRHSLWRWLWGVVAQSELARIDPWFRALRRERFTFTVTGTSGGTTISTAVNVTVQ